MSSGSDSVSQWACFLEEFRVFQGGDGGGGDLVELIRYRVEGIRVRGSAFGSTSAWDIGIKSKWCLSAESSH